MNWMAYKYYSHDIYRVSFIHTLNSGVSLLLNYLPTPDYRGHTYAHDDILYTIVTAYSRLGK